MSGTGGVEHGGLLIAAILGLGILAQWLAWRVKLPAILFLLLIGMAIGPGLGWLDPDALFGELLFPAVSLGVAVILFEGALTLRLAQIRGHGQVVSRLVSLGALITWAASGMAAHWLLGVSWEVAMLFGGLASVTGPTVVVPLLRTVKPKASVANILRWEGILIDPIGALMVVLVFEFVVSGRQEGHTLGVFAELVGVGAVFGGLGAALVAAALRRQLLPDYLRNLGVLALVLVVFSTANLLVEESGLLAVTVMGMVLANLPRLDLEDILDFKETLTLLFISVLFIVLAARVQPAELMALGWAGVALLALLQLVVRPLAVAVSTWGSSLAWGERALIAWIAPRGIVAAAVSALFALKLEQLAVPGAELLVPLTFSVIIVTVVLQSATARPVALALDACDPEARGVLLMGGGDLARAIGRALQAQGIPVLLSDTRWERIRAARMEGLPTYFGNLVSEHADRHLDLVGIGHLCAMSSRPAMNTLASLRYRREFGARHVYALRVAEDHDSGDKRQPVAAFRPPALFGARASRAALLGRIGKGHKVKATSLTEAYGFQDHLRANGASALPLFAIDEQSRLRVFHDQRELDPQPGWTLLSLVEDDPEPGDGVH